MSTYFRLPSAPPTVASIHSQASVVYSGGTLIPFWYDQQPGAALLTSGFSPTGVSGVATSGFVAACSDGGTGIYLLQHAAGVVHVSGGGITLLPAPSGTIFTGLTLGPSNIPYMVDGGGEISKVSGGAVVTGVGSFGTSPAYGLALSGTTLYTALPAAGALGSFETGGLTSGTVATPMTVPALVAASGSHVAAGGWSGASLVSGFAAIAVNPVSGAIFAGATPATSSVTLWSENVSGAWSETQSVTGGQTSFLAWSPDSTRLFGCDPVSGVVLIWNFVFGALVFAQTLAVSGASAIAITPDSLNALVCQQTQNQVTALVTAGSGMATSGTVPFVSPGGIAALTNTSMVVGGVSSGGVSGISDFALTAGNWSSGVVTNFNFLPSYIALVDDAGYVAAGTVGTSGVLNFNGTSSGSFVGGVSGLVYQQGQVIVGDPTHSRLQVFGIVASGLTFEASGVATPSGLQTLAASPSVLFAAASGVTWLYEGLAPYEFAQVRSGVVSIYDGAAWSTATLGIGNIPTAMTFDPSGNVSVITANNIYNQIDTSASVVSSAQIAQFSGQPQATTEGISSLTWFAGSLFGTSSVNESAVQIV